MEKVFVADLRVGQSVQSYFLLDKKEKRPKKNGEFYLHAVLADRTGSMEANLWDRIDEAFDRLLDTPVVCVQGLVREYNGKIQMTINQIGPCPVGDYDIGTLIKTLPNLDAVEKRIVQYLDAMTDQSYKKIASYFLSDEKFMAKFRKCPGGMKWHHAYVGGLVQHTYEVMRIGAEMCDMHPEVNRDMVVLGAFLHDVGKVDELDYALNFDYTDDGRLLGHIAIGYGMVLESLRAIDVADAVRKELLHIVLSHQGTYDQRSPVVPQTIEACIVYHADHLTSQVSAFKSVVYGPRADGERWSRYFPTIDRQLLLRNEQEHVL